MIAQLQQRTYTSLITLSELTDLPSHLSPLSGPSPSEDKASIRKLVAVASDSSWRQAQAKISV